MVPGTGNDAIRLAFMNRKNGCKGKVTKVEQVSNGADLLVFVYFANFEGDTNFSTSFWQNQFRKTAVV